MRKPFVKLIIFKYFPTVGDIVVGVIMLKSAENFRVDIGSPTLANLSNIAFNSATKRHRPNLKVGQVVLCHVVGAHKFLDVEVSCEDPSSQKDWVTNEVYFGALPEGGLLVQLPVRLGRSLAEQGSEMFNLIGQYLKPFELATGMNGRIYIRTAEGDNLRAVLIAKILEQINASMSLSGLENLCQEMQGRLQN